MLLVSVWLTRFEDAVNVLFAFTASLSNKMDCKVCRRGSGKRAGGVLSGLHQQNSRRKREK